MFLQLLFHFAPPPLPSLSYFPLKSKDGGILINVYICTLHAFLNQTLNVIKTRGGERGDLVKIFNEISSFLPSLVSGSCTNTRQVPQKFGHIEKKNCFIRWRIPYNIYITYIRWVNLTPIFDKHEQNNP